MTNLEQDIERIYAEHRAQKRRERRQIGLFVAGVVVVGAAFLVGLTFTLGKGAVTSALMEQGLCIEGDCSVAQAQFYAAHESQTGVGSVLLDWCVGTDELSNHTVGRRAWIAFPLIKLLQMPCGEV